MEQFFLQECKIKTWILSSKDTLTQWRKPTLKQKHSLMETFFCKFLDVANKIFHTDLLLFGNK